MNEYTLNGERENLGHHERLLMAPDCELLCWKAVLPSLNLFIKTLSRDVTLSVKHG